MRTWAWATCAIWLVSTPAWAQPGEEDSPVIEEPVPDADAAEDVPPAEEPIPAPVAPTIAPQPIEATRTMNHTVARTADAAATEPEFRIGGGLDVIAQYRLSIFNENDAKEVYHEYEMPRVHAIVFGSYDIAHARVVLEAVRSTSEGALVGVAGESFVMRLREAYAGLTLFDRLELQAGVVPTFSIRAVESAWAMRAVAPVALQRTVLFSPADVGARAHIDLPLGLGYVGVGTYNGEGYPGRELNRGKTTEIAARIHPFATLSDSAAPFTAFASYIGGSSGTGLARANRINGGLMWDAEAIGAGVTATYAMGVEDDGGRNSVLLEGFLRGNPVLGLLLAGQVSHWWRDVDAPSRDGLLTITSAAGWRVVKPLDILAAFDVFLPSDITAAALPQLDDYAVRLVARFAAETSL